MATFPDFRIAVLECDTPLIQTREKYGGYGGVFEVLLKAGARHAGIPEGNIKVSKFDVVEKMEYPQLEDVDAVLLTGSRHNSFDNDEWIKKLVAFTQKVLDQDRVRIIGICYGHQIVGRALGVQVGRSDRGWEASVCDVDLTAKGKELFGKDKLAIHQMHKDIVFAYPESVEPLGSSPRCEVQGMYAAKRLITVQGHPEFNEQIVRELLETRHEQKIFDDATYQDAIDRVANSQDGVMIAGAFLKFLLET